VELLNYIKELLLLNDCVIIPGFGGFLGNYKPASIQNATFSPPSKAVSFNEKLKVNDGLLINHIVDKEAESYVAVSKRVKLLVQEMNYRLTDGETIHIGGIGDLFYDQNESLAFTPVISENLNLDGYGLKPFNYETLYAKKLTTSKISQEGRDVVQVFFQKGTLKKVLFAIPVLFVLALVPIKNNNENLQVQKSDLSSLADMMMTKEKTHKAAPEAKFTEEAARIEEQDQNHRYFLIGGSFRDESNASKFIQQKMAEGYTARDLGVIKGLHYIALDSFAKFGEAKSAQEQIHSKSPSSGVWIYVKK
jgi:nucleoid DNA-binding protein